MSVLRTLIQGSVPLVGGSLEGDNLPTPYFCNVTVKIECTFEGLEGRLGVKKQRLDVSLGGKILPLWLQAEAKAGLSAGDTGH